MPQGIQPRRIVFVLDEVAGIIEIDIIVRVATRKILDVVVAAQPDNPADQLRVTESEIDSMVRTKASPGSDQVRVGIMLEGERQDFVTR